MGGAAPASNAKHGRKSLDAQLNLVPFIDLLSCLISFLLITAVWTNTGRVHAETTGSLTTQEPPPGDKTSIRIVLTDRGFMLSIGGNMTQLDRVPVARGITSPGGYDLAGLSVRLIEAKRRFSDQHAVTIAAEDGVRYEDLVGTIDAVTAPAVGLEEVSVTPA